MTSNTPLRAAICLLTFLFLAALPASSGPEKRQLREALENAEALAAARPVDLVAPPLSDSFWIRAIGRAQLEGQQEASIAEALESPFSIRDLIRAKFLRQRALTILLMTLADPAADQFDVWMGGDDLNAVQGSFPWAALDVAILPIKAGDPESEVARSLTLKLRKMTEPAATLPGYLRVLDEPGRGGGLRMSFAKLGTHPMALAAAFRERLQDDQEYAIQESEWSQWSDQLAGEDPFRDVGLIELRIPELRGVLRNPAHVQILTTALESPDLLSRAFTPLLKMQIAFRGARSDAMEASRAVKLARDSASDRDTSIYAILDAAVARYQFLATEIGRQEQLTQILEGKPLAFDDLLHAFLEIYPEPFMDSSQRESLRDRGLLKLARVPERTPAELVRIGDALSPYADRERPLILSMIEAALGKMEEPERKSLLLELKHLESKTSTRVLLREVSRETTPTTLLDRIGIVPVGDILDIYSVVTMASNLQSSLLGCGEIRGRVLQLYLDRQFRGGLFLEYRTLTSMESTAIEQDIDALLTPPVAPEHYLIGHELVRHSPDGDSRDLFNLAKALSRKLDDLGIGSFTPIRRLIHDDLSPEAIARVREFRNLLRTNPDLDVTKQVALEESQKLLNILERIHDKDRAREDLTRLVQDPLIENVAIRLHEFIQADEEDPVEAFKLAARVRADLRRSVEDPTLESGEIKRKLIEVDLSLSQYAIPVYGLIMAMPPPAPPLLDPAVATLCAALAQALFADGLLDPIELETFEMTIDRFLDTGQVPQLSDWRRFSVAVERIVEWSHSNARRAFGETVDRSRSILPYSAYGFLDNLVRTSSLLPMETLLAGLSNSIDIEAHRLGDTGQAPPVHRIGADTYRSGVRGINPGRSQGILRVLQGDQATRDPLELNREEIYALDVLRPDMRPSRGFLTLQQGSSLSHLQLLARSIGIPSAILSERAWRSLAPLDGEEVVLDVRGDRSVLIALVDRDMPAPLTTDSVSSSRVLTLPEVDTKTTDILPLNKVTLEIRPPVAGRKASTLGTLRESELKSVVPDGVVIPFGIYEELLSRSGADGTIDDLASRLQSGGSSVDCEKQLQRIRQKLIGTSFSSRRRSEIAGALERAFKSAGVFVRSDSNIEDLPQFTGAGLNLTLPNVKGRSEVLDAIKKVWSSLWSDRGFAWRRDRIRDQRSVKGSILIMRAIDARKAGVMMTRDLEDGGDRKIFISAHEGLGIKVVEGSETPEELVVDLETGAVEYRRFSKAKVKIVLDPKGGVMSVPRRPFGKILTLDEIRDLTLVAASLQQTLSRYGSTQWNVEWLFDEESKLRVLQARPYSN